MHFLEIKDLSFGYNKRDFVLKNFSLQIKKGEIHCLLGANGLGKSTLLHLIGGFLKPHEGSVFLDEKALTHTPAISSLPSSAPSPASSASPASPPS